MPFRPLAPQPPYVEYRYIRDVDPGTGTTVHYGPYATLDDALDSARSLPTTTWKITDLNGRVPRNLIATPRTVDPKVARSQRRRRPWRNVTPVRTFKWSMVFLLICFTIAFPPFGFAIWFWWGVKKAFDIGHGEHPWGRRRT